MPHQIPPGINSPNASPVETGASTLVMVFRADYSSSSQPGNPMADQVAQRTLAVLNRFALLKMFSTTRAGAHGHLVHSRSAPAAKLSQATRDRKSTRLNTSHVAISYAVFCLKKKNQRANTKREHNTTQSAT